MLRFAQQYSWRPRRWWHREKVERFFPLSARIHYSASAGAPLIFFRLDRFYRLTIPPSVVSLKDCICHNHGSWNECELLGSPLRIQDERAASPAREMFSVGWNTGDYFPLGCPTFSRAFRRTFAWLPSWRLTHGIRLVSFFFFLYLKSLKIIEHSRITWLNCCKTYLRLSPRTWWSMGTGGAAGLSIYSLWSSALAFQLGARVCGFWWQDLGFDWGPPVVGTRWCVFSGAAWGTVVHPKGWWTCASFSAARWWPTERTGESPVGSVSHRAALACIPTPPPPCPGCAQVRRLFLLLSAEETAMDIPVNLEARRRVSFFATSLFMGIPSAPKTRNMLSFRFVWKPHFQRHAPQSQGLQLFKITLDVIYSSQISHAVRLLLELRVWPRGSDCVCVGAVSWLHTTRRKSNSLTGIFIQARMGPPYCPTCRRSTQVIWVASNLDMIYTPG